jgi:acetyl-CoA carboxylase biotin carboxylase subunit
MFKKVLIANRGEIAVRIMQTLQEMGIVAVAVYSEVDAQAYHVQKADEAYPLPGKTSAESYLRGDFILEIAKRCGAEAIHPGYGFLSENARFAAQCAQAGIQFIGPTPAVIESMGDKIIAKKTMEAAGVPVVPGWVGDLSTPVELLKQEAQRIGYPILVKAAAGGGGKGMRLVHQESEMAGALEAAAREAQNAFGDPRVFLEKYINRPRHVEFQIFGDTHGNVVHLFERECSIQRRHQKIVEETPCVALTPELRAQMGEAAVLAAKAIGYTNAGTVEFILDEAHHAFYFLEVNTRLQVEHPITEMTTHQDLVRAQLLVAAGEALPFKQEDLTQDGHAFECRVYAEDPGLNFMPSTGTLWQYHPPEGPNIRVDSGVAQGNEVSIYYDPMLSKLVVWGKTRQQALEKMQWALSHYAVLGVKHNIGYLANLFQHPAFQAGNIHTHFLQEHSIASEGGVTLPADLDTLPLSVLLGAWAGAYGNAPGNAYGNGQAATQEDSLGSPPTPWETIGSWRAV